MPTVELISAGGTLNLNGNDTVNTIWLEEEDGLGLAPLHRLQERGPLQHGASDLGYRLDPRVITLVLGVGGNSLAETYAARRTLMRVCNTGNRPLQLRYTLPDGAVRQIDCFYSGEMSFPSNQRQGFWERTAVRMIAPDPTFYDPRGESVIFRGSGGTGFTVPMPVPTSVGGSELTGTIVPIYAGDADSYPIVRIAGPVTNPVVLNIATPLGQTTENLYLDFTGTTLLAGEYLEIDTRYGAKTVKDQSGANRIGSLVPGTSDLSSFRIVAGSNDLRVRGTDATSASFISLVWFARYIGI